jgi:uncharacterized membrane protein
MIGRFFGFLVLTLIVAAAFHAAAILLAPQVIMNVAFDRVSQNGRAANTWIWRERVNPEHRDIVQPSPDLAYGACAFDLTRGPVRIRIAPGADYVSLSLYADNTDNFFAVIGPGDSAPAGAARVVRSPSMRGLALERRLSPTAAAFAAADQARRTGVCERWNAIPGS